MAKLAIRGHATHGNEVIELLKMLGGINKYNLRGNTDEWFVLNGTQIQRSDRLFAERYFTLEEFLGKFPYKVGDKVTHNMGILMNIVRMYWDFKCDVVRYDIQSPVDNNYKLKSMLAEHLQPYKEDVMEEKLMPRIDLTEYCKDKYIIYLGNYEIKEENGKTYAVRKQFKYPKIYEECCKLLSLGEDGRLYTKGYKASLIQNFQKLIICRDAYWKIAGNWKFDFDKSCYYLCNEYNSVQKFSGRIDCNAILTFPTEEMRDVFYDNFKELIESCKELL